MDDIAGNFKYNSTDAAIIKQILKHEATPEAIQLFNDQCGQLTDYGYWFLLSTLWISYSGQTDINLWKDLFRSERPRREISIMKPTERKAYKRLPYFITVYRAHRPNEKDWIAYTTDIETAYRFAQERGVDEIAEYIIKKRDVIGYFLRRGESEIIMLDQEKAKYIKSRRNG